METIVSIPEFDLATKSAKALDAGFARNPKIRIAHAELAEPAETFLVCVTMPA